MPQTVFLDTNVMLDYLENRHQDVRDIIAQLLLFHKQGKVVLATSTFNVVELIDQEFQIHFYGWCLNEKMSYDEIVQKINRDEKLFLKISSNKRNDIEKAISNFIYEKEIQILTFDLLDDYKQLYNLLYEKNIRSQDALVVTAASANKVTYFLSNDNNLASKVDYLFNVYNLRNKESRKNFVNNVLEAII